MFYPSIWNIIADYVSPDVNISSIYSMNWPYKMFFRMELSDLRDIIDHLNPSVVSDIKHYIGHEQIRVICNINSMDKSRSLAPNVVDICRILHDIISSRTDESKNKSNIKCHHEYVCYCCHNHPDSNYRYVNDRVDKSELLRRIQYDCRNHARWTTVSIINCNISYLSRFCHDIDQLLDTFTHTIDYKALSSNLNIGNNLSSLIKRAGDKLCWNSILRNESIPVETIRTLVQKVNNSIIKKRFDQMDINTILNDEKAYIPGDLLSREDAPLTKIITYYHRLTPYHLQIICTHPNAPFELLFKKFVGKLPRPSYLKSYSPKIELSTSNHEKLPYNICANPNIPFDILFDRFENNIDWIDLCANPNIPVSIFTNNKYFGELKTHRLVFNECLPFDKVIKFLPDISNNFIKFGNRGYYTYLVKQALMNVLVDL